MLTVTLNLNTNKHLYLFSNDIAHIIVDWDVNHKAKKEPKHEKSRKSTLRQSVHKYIAQVQLS